MPQGLNGGLNKCIYMSLYFEIKVTYDKTMENGMVKKVTELYLFDALSFTEAESRAIEELTPPLHQRRVYRQGLQAHSDCRNLQPRS